MVFDSHRRRGTGFDGVGCNLGIDLGATSMRFARVDAGGGAYLARPTPRGKNAKADLVSGIRAVAGGLPVLSVGVSRAPGLNAEGTVNSWPSKPDWEGVPLFHWLQLASGQDEIVSADDGLCAAIWESGMSEPGQAQVDLSVACVSIGTGLAVGVCRGKHPLALGDGAATLGHQRFGGIATPCRCGRRGCLQTLLSVAGLEALERGEVYVEVASALRDFAGALRDRYCVSRLIVSGGAISRFGPGFLHALFDPPCRACGIKLSISSTPQMSALAGALMLAGGSLQSQEDSWTRRVAAFVMNHDSSRFNHPEELCASATHGTATSPITSFLSVG